MFGTLGSVKTKREILTDAKKLKNHEKWSRVFITPDLAPKEREKSRSLRDELRRRINSGEEGLMIRKGKIVQVPQDRPGSPPASPLRDPHGSPSASQEATGGLPLFR